MLTRRDWLESITAISELFRARFSRSTGAQVAASGEPTLFVPRWQAWSKSGRIQPIVAVSEDIPVYGFGSVDIRGACPDLVLGAELQMGNTAYAVNILMK
jgi:hypothetical protein